MRTRLSFPMAPTAALLGLVLVGCTTGGAHVSQTADKGVVRGTVIYRERMALPPDAVVEVRLSDVSRQDIAAPVIAETTVLPEGRQVPLPFELRYDSSRIQPDRTYAVRATIRSAGRMIFTTAALKAFGDRVQDSAMGVQEILPPIPDALYDPKNADKSSHLMIEKGSAADSQALKDAKLYYQADLIIEEEKAYDPAGNEILLDKYGCWDAKGKKAVRKEKFYDGREKMDVEVTQIDIGALTACGVMLKNGILYASEKPGSAEPGQGVRLVNGAQLPKQGLTVVSGNPVYIQGDYNTVNKVPAAVLADAITVLSNNWDKNNYDKKGKDMTSKRPADKTTVNAAFATGPSHESVMDKSNGQMNNLIRFLEDWQGVDFTYNGSLVALWHSQLATEWFRCCGSDGDNYYTPPNRIWSYETLFNTHQPPGAPMGIIYTRGQWTEG